MRLSLSSKCNISNVMNSKVFIFTDSKFSSFYNSNIWQSLASIIEERREARNVKVIMTNKDFDCKTDTYLYELNASIGLTFKFLL